MTSKRNRRDVAKLKHKLQIMNLENRVRELEAQLVANDKAMVEGTLNLTQQLELEVGRTFLVGWRANGGYAVPDPRVVEAAGRSATHYWAQPPAQVVDFAENALNLRRVTVSVTTGGTDSPSVVIHPVDP